MDYKSNIFTEVNNNKNNFSLSGEFYKENTSVLIIKVSGYLETANSDIFSKSILKTIDDNNDIKIFIIDLKYLNYISSTGIGALTIILNEVKKQKIGLYLINLNEKALSIIELLGFNKFFNILDSEEEIDNIINKIKSNLAFTCNKCSKKVIVPKPGKYKCPACNNLMNIK